jgi:FlaA1/EpsC-like NDP-sugar epimerase
MNPIDKKDNTKRSKSIFICYETLTGLDYAKHLKKALKKIGRSAFVADEDIDKTIKECKYFLVIVTFAALESEEVKREINLVQKFNKNLKQKKIIIPCKEKEVYRSWLSKLPVISELQQIEFENKEDLARKVISEILKRETVKVTIESVPSADVYINGRKVGRT